MRRYIEYLCLLSATLFLLGSASSAFCQDASTPESSVSSDEVQIQQLPVRPPTPVREASYQQLLGDMVNHDRQVTNRTVSQRIARIYRYQANLVEAEAANDTAGVEIALERAMNELQALIEHRSVIQQPRVRELYQAIVSEYESYHGTSDSLHMARGQIFTVRDTLFAALEALDQPLLEDVMMPEIPAMETTIPMDTNRLVHQSISYLVDSPDKHLYNWISRAHTYFPMIEEVLAEENVPDELKYLAMIESALNPRAQSWAAAVGMWQFMRGTARLYGLEVNHWVDERRNPEKSTRAAAQYLQNLYERFDDWHLAIAAYNAGPGRVERALRTVRSRTGNDDPSFWDAWQYLPRETRNYVPMFIATSLVVSNKNKFNLREVEPGPTYEYDLVPVEGMIDLQTIASLAGTDVSTIRALNPQIRRSATPPSEGPYMMRIPLGSYEQFAEGYAELPDDMKRSIEEYRVKRGDTLGEIAARFGVSVRELRQANDVRGHIIRVGQRLMVPVPDYSGTSSQLASAEPTRVQYDGSRSRPIRLNSSTAARAENEDASEVGASNEIASAEPANSAATGETDDIREEPASDTETDDSSPEKVVHPVRYGDTLIEIADRYDVYVRDLRSWNDLSNDTIRPGQQLVIYTNRDTSEGAGTTEDQEGNQLIYRVQPGDTIGEIAERYGVATRQVRSWNDLHGSRIYAGQRLTIYSDNPNVATETYHVQPGDSLYVIARKHGVSVQQLRRWNDLSSNTIKPGQTLRVSG
jgi:membrane-bound lytic murein transglycosylase D